jgi:hypothetical protein
MGHQYMSLKSIITPNGEASRTNSWYYVNDINTAIDHHRLIYLWAALLMVSHCMYVCGLGRYALCRLLLLFVRLHDVPSCHPWIDLSSSCLA